MSTKITFNLSQKSIQSAIKELEAYKATLPSKCEELVRRLADIGYDASKAILDRHIYSGKTIGSIRIENGSNGEIKRMAIVVESEAILFLEFGSGIRYSSTVNPKAREIGYGPGTYQGKGHWDDPDGWWYLGDDGKWHHSYGIEAAMPMYLGSRAMIESVGKIAKEVFRG